MKCYNPRLAFVNPAGGRPHFTQFSWAQFVGNHKLKIPSYLGDSPLKMPCNKCEACRLEHARQRAVRCHHQVKTSGCGSFLTLTYDPKHLPPGGTLMEEHAVKFMKDLRRRICHEDSCYGKRFNWETLKMVRGCRGFCREIKSFGCAEYGSKFLRPHYHLLIFGYDFPDKTYWRGGAEHGTGHATYRSKLLEGCWKRGHSEIGSLTFKSAAYVARYVQKKARKKSLPPGLAPERAICISRRPGIGREFFELYYRDMYRVDAVFDDTRGKQGIPRYYDVLLQKLDPEMFSRIKLDRRSKRPIDERENGTERMAVRKQVHTETLKKLQRSYED